MNSPVSTMPEFDSIRFPVWRVVDLRHAGDQDDMAGLGLKYGAGAFAQHGLSSEVCSMLRAVLPHPNGTTSIGSGKLPRVPARASCGRP